MKKAITLILLLIVSTLQWLKAQDTTVNICPIIIDETGENSLLKVFPNPSNGTFQIVYASTTSCPPPGWGGILIINISNSKFETVYTETILEFEGEYNKTIDLSLEEKGTYLIQVIAGNQRWIKREVLN